MSNDEPRRSIERQLRGELIRNLTIPAIMLIIGVAAIVIGIVIIP